MTLLGPEMQLILALAAVLGAAAYLVRVAIATVRTARERWDVDGEGGGGGSQEPCGGREAPGVGSGSDRGPARRGRAGPGWRRCPGCGGCGAVWPGDT